MDESTAREEGESWTSWTILEVAELERKAASSPERPLERNEEVISRGALLGQRPSLLVSTNVTSARPRLLA